MTIAFGILLTPQEVAAVPFAIQDINPSRSNTDPRNPNAASGGRINGLAAGRAAGSTPRAYYLAASEWGGLYKSEDNGRGWHHVAGFLPTATWDVEISPENPNLAVATSFFDGRTNSLSGIAISRDAGVHWQTTASRPPEGFCDGEARREEPSAFGISFDPNDPRRIFVGTNCGLAMSRDRGLHWSYVDPTPADPADDIWDVAVRGNVVDVCGQDGHLRSIDGGATWTSSTSLVRPRGGRCSIAISPDEGYVIFLTERRQIYESNDGGQTWTVIANPHRQGRIPFVATNQRANSGGADRFDLWFGDTRLFRRNCTTPATPTPGGATRCPGEPAGTDGIDSDGDCRDIDTNGDGVVCGPGDIDDNRGVDEPDESWVLAQRGAHWDAGDVAFDPLATTDACPVVYSNDGGVYFNTKATTPGCHDPAWEQPFTTPHALWTYDMAGAHHDGLQEDLYFGNQDTGSFGVTSTHFQFPPAWNNRDCCDVFDVAAEPTRVVNTVCCTPGTSRLNRVYIRDRGLGNGRELETYPPGDVPSFRSMDSIANFGASSYAITTTDGVFVTTNIASGSSTTWTQLGTAASTPAGPCGIRVARAAGTPHFFVKSQACNPRLAGALWTHAGTATGGNWQPIQRNGSSRFGVFAVDPTDPNRIIASDLRTPAEPEMVMTEDGGGTWRSLPQLDELMTAGGLFHYRNARGYIGGMSFTGYPQPMLVEFDPDDRDIVVAGAWDSGVFVSLDGGDNWQRMTPFPGSSLQHNPNVRPQIPRPHHAYIDHNEGDPNYVQVYLATKGRGAWRINFTARPPDLVAHSLGHSPLHCVDSDSSIRFFTVVKNIGTKPAGPSKVAFELTGETDRRVYDVPRLSEGATFRIEREATVAAGNHTSRVTVDLNGDVGESSEDNNDSEHSYLVLESCPDPAPPRPTGFRLRALRLGSAILSWDSLSSIDGFVVERRHGGSEAQTWELDGSQTSFITPRQPSCSGYSYTVRSVKGARMSSPAGPLNYLWDDGTCPF